MRTNEVESVDVPVGSASRTGFRKLDNDVFAPKPAAVVRLRDSTAPRDLSEGGDTKPQFVQRNSPGRAVAQALTGVREARPPANSDPEDLTGTIISDRYKLLRLLDRGGMGYVYYAKHTAIDKRLAVKVLSLKCARSEQHRTRLLREARACSQIAHENVVDIQDFGQAPNGSVFIAMELLKGEPLAATIDREGAMPWRRAKPIILQICRALHAAHTKGILHRDMKPDNCWRTKRGANKDFIKVYDFGLAKLLQDDSYAGSKQITSAGTIFGTPEYMSPEQARGEKTDHRSDLYSTAIILYEMLTGTVPFLAENFLDVLAMQATDTPRSPRLLAPEGAVSRRLERVILKALRKHPGERYQSMQEFATALAEIPLSETPRPNTVQRKRTPAPARAPGRKSTGTLTPRQGITIGQHIVDAQATNAGNSVTLNSSSAADLALAGLMSQREKVYLGVIAAQALALAVLGLAFVSMAFQ